MQISVQQKFVKKLKYSTKQENKDWKEDLRLPRGAQRIIRYMRRAAKNNPSACPYVYHGFVPYKSFFYGFSLWFQIKAFPIVTVYFIILFVILEI